MNNLELKAAAKEAAAQVIGPLARLLLDVGLSARDLQEIGRMGFVRAAVAKGESSTPPATSDSDIAVVTGLTRRDVARLRERGADESDASDVGRHRAERVLNAWCHDPEFQQGSEPARLPLRGQRFSFGALVRKHSPDPRARTILRELERVKAVRRGADGKVEVVRKTYAPLAFSPEAIVELGRQCHDLLQTLVHNLHHPRRPLYQRRAVNRSLTPNQAAILMRSIVLQADAAMDALDAALNDPPLDPSVVTKVDSVSVGVGFYLTREPVEREFEHAGVVATQASPQRGRSRRTRVKRERRGKKD